MDPKVPKIPTHLPHGNLDLTGLVLSTGAHSDDSKEMCAMEAVSLYCGCVAKTDRPECASQVIGSFVRHINDTGGAYVRSRLVSRIPALAVSKDTDAAHSVRRATFFAERAKLQAASWAARAASEAASGAASEAASGAARAASWAAREPSWDFALETLDLVLALQ